MTVKTPWNTMTKGHLVDKLRPQTLAAHTIRVMEGRAASSSGKTQTASAN